MPGWNALAKRWQASMAIKESLPGRVTGLLTQLDRSSPRAWLGIVLLVTLIQRSILLFFYQPVSYNDTPSYRRLADSILLGFAHYDGTRTPGFPLVLALFGSDESVWLAQMIMGILVTLLLFYLGWQISGHAWVGGLAALAHTLNPGQLFFEANLLSETATTFWLVLSFSGVVWWIYHSERRSAWLAFGLGLAASLAWLTRPLFVFLPFWLLIFLIRGEQVGNLGSLRAFARKLPKFPNLIVWLRVLVYLIPVLLLLGGWVSYIHQRFHMWSLTTMTGYVMVQHTGVFFQYVPDEYAALRDTYIRYRDAHIAQYGTQANTIWEAIPEMQKVSGKTFLDLSRLLTRISIQLIRAHPDLFARNLIEGWWYFWRAPVYWSPDLLHLGILVPVLKGIVLVERLGLFGLNLVFLVTSALALVSRKARSTWKVSTALWCLLGTVWLTSLIQTFLDHGDNPRFLIPLQSVVVLWVLWVSVQSLRSWLASIALKTIHTEEQQTLPV